MRRSAVCCLLALLSLIPVLISGCAGETDFDGQVDTLARPYRFELARWEFRTLFSELGNLFAGRPDADEGAAIVSEYFSSDQRDKAIVTLVEAAIEAQVREAYSEHGIFNPLDRCVTTTIGFPPVNIYLGAPPHLLVISSRGKIETLRKVILVPEMTVKEAEELEAEVDKLGVSSLVVSLGGIATYPSYVIEDASLPFILDVVAEEWMHQYLAFTPLGFLYVLDVAGLRPDYDIVTINETVAGIVSKEIGSEIYERYYAVDDEPVDQPVDDDTGFDFNAAMRKTRLAVDAMLDEGQVEEAESYMEERRQYLEDNGYYIRKLNQAYFAMHGTYADSETSVDPIGDQLQELRAESESLKDFLDGVVTMGSADELTERLR